jgi:hypothetical protein
MKLVGERRALAATVLAFYFIMNLMNALLGDPDARGVFYVMAGVYGLAFFALVAGYFWARWYSVGVGLFGVIVAIVAMWVTKTIEQQFVFFLGTHLVVTLGLWGQAMSEPFDGQQAWRQKFHMDDNAVQRLGRSVIRAGVMLPFILIYAVAPKQGMDLVSVGALVLAVLGFRGLVQLKTWGIISMGIAGFMMLGMPSHQVVLGGQAISLASLPIALLMFAVAAPFVRPMARFIRA